MKRIALVILLAIVPALLFAQQELDSIMVLRPFDEFRDEIQAGGDINGDGFDDIVIAEKVEGFELPRVAVYFGGNRPDNIPDCIMTEDNDFIRGGYGSSIAYNGDLNGDGIDDLVISDNLYTEQSAGCWGRVYIYFGSSNFDTIPDVVLDGIDYVEDWWWLGFGKVDISGDINGDGINDLIVSSSGPTQFFNGHIHIFYGGQDFDTICDWHKKGGNNESFGYDYSLGDINGDIYDDLVVIRQRFQEEYVPMEVYAGGEELSNEPVWTTVVYNCGEFHLLSAFGDINGDGCADIVCGKNYDSTSIYFGEQNFNLEENEVLPIRCPFVTNINDDNYCDIGGYVGHPDTSVYMLIYNGETSMDDQYDYILDCDILGMYGSDLGDINNDNNTDIMLKMRDGNLDWYMAIFTEDYVQSIEDNKTIAYNHDILIDNYPNPFKNKTSISFDIPKGVRDANISIYNVRGQLVKTLMSGGDISGSSTIIWDGTNDGGGNVSSGIYFCKIKVSGVEYVKKLLMFK